MQNNEHRLKHSQEGYFLHGYELSREKNFLYQSHTKNIHRFAFWDILL